MERIKESASSAFAIWAGNTFWGLGDVDISAHEEYEQDQKSEGARQVFKKGTSDAS